MEYRYHQQPGCGGCFLFLVLLLLLTGGAPLVFQFAGFLLFTLLFLVVAAIAAFWGFSIFIRRQVSNYERSQTESHNKFVFLLVHVLVKIAQIDGTVTREELAAINRFFQVNLRYSQSQMYWVKELVKEALASTVSLEEHLLDFRNQFAYEPRLILLELIYQVLFTNHQVVEAELQLVRNIAGYLEISAADQQTLESRYRGGARAATARTQVDEAGHYRVFGLSPDAPFDEVKAAYRKLSMQYHPDKVSHLGSEFLQVAEEKMKELNIAYDFIKNKHKNNR